MEINVWPNNDLIIFPGLLMVDPEQGSPPDGGSTVVVWGSQRMDMWQVYNKGWGRNEEEHAWLE